MNKKILILLAFGLCLVIFAIWSRNNSPERRIIGTWELQNSMSESTLTFKADKTMTDVIPKETMFGFEIGGTYEGTYEIKGNEITLTYSGMADLVQDPSMTCTFEIKGKTLYMDGEFNTITYKKVK